MQLARTPFWVLERNVGDAFFRLRRTDVPMDSLERFVEHQAVLERALGRADVSRLGMIIDLRDGPSMRNDAAFEQAARPFQEKLMHRFGRVAILVKTPAGKLQVERIVRAIGGNVRVFSDEPAALAFVAGR